MTNTWKGSAVAVAVLCCVGYVQAETGFAITAANLYESDGVTLAPQSTLALLVVDSGNDGLGTISAGDSLIVGSTIGGADNVIVGRFDCSAPGQDGVLQAYSIVSYGGLVVAGKDLALLWFPTLTLANTTAVGGAPYGVHEDPTGIQAAIDSGSNQDNASVPWVLPTDQGAVWDLNFYTASSAAYGLAYGYPDSAGIANAVVVPEPSTLALAILGLLGVVCITRHRGS
jgi:hypothetical protein